MITYEKPYQAQAHIHSLDGAMDEIRRRYERQSAHFYR